jgi:hypothetical protein
MKRCRNCGDTFAFKHYAEWYCSSPVCQASKYKRTSTRRVRLVMRERPGEDQAARTSGHERQPVSSAGGRAPERDAEAALIELQAWAARERAKW